MVSPFFHCAIVVVGFLSVNASTIRHNVYRDIDIPRLWSDGFLVTGGIRPHLTVAINQLSDTSTEVTREAATFEIYKNQ